MCYTSGTTGHPKGVVYSHRSSVLHAFMVGLADVMGICERDVVMAMVPMFHANAWGLPYACLLLGADLVLPGRFMAPDMLARLLVDRAVTFAGGVPTLWQTMFEPLKSMKDSLRLDRVVSGGAAIPASLQKAYAEALGVRVCHAWGMTETSPCASVSRPLGAHGDLAPEELGRVLNSQGRIVPGVEVRIVGEDGREAPWDGRSVGEIQVRGNTIAAGYYKDPESAERFQDGWLRTGDVASIDPQGYVRIADRTKDLIKSGGEWISSVCLEGLLMGHPDVAEAAVIAVSHHRWSERPLACVVARPEARERLDRQALVNFLRPHVARWWLPDDVVFLDEIPKTSVGKFDKKALRERYRNHALPEPDVSSQGL
jgi:fatty-acyl-CoA synthase